MRISIASHEFEAMIVASGPGGLQTLVSRAIDVREIVYILKIRELSGKRQNRSPRCRGGLIEVNDARKFRSMVANVADIESKPAGKSMLDAQSPVLHVRSAKIALHSEGVTRRSRATLN